MQPLLSILIPTVVGRGNELTNLVCVIKEQYELTPFGRKEVDGYVVWTYGGHDGIIEVVTVSDAKEHTIGEKREFMYSIAKGVFSWQIDDDDSISPDALRIIYEAIKSNPEIPCITFRERCMMNGVYKSSNHSIIYGQWMDNQDGFDYVRSPFYKDVIRTDLARSVPFEKVRYNEDEKFSYAIRHLLTSEIHIDKELYYYIYQETNHNDRYGIK